MSNKVAVIGLFSGAGGLDIGASWAGGDVRLSVDNDPVACATLCQNRHHHHGIVLAADVATLDGKTLRRAARLSPRDPCIVVGGPPCQPFSKAAYWTDSGEDARFRRARAKGEAAVKPSPITEARPDARLSLVQEFWRLVLESRANGFVFENVPSILHPRNRHIIEDLAAEAEKAHYGTLLAQVNAAEFGVPQCRQRVGLLGLHRGTPAAPFRTHSSGSNWPTR